MTTFSGEIVSYFIDCEAIEETETELLVIIPERDMHCWINKAEIEDGSQIKKVGDVGILSLKTRHTWYEDNRAAFTSADLDR